jgi:hypothetical protein
MNLIEISEQLKDVPDQYLVSEVQNPTGSYPAYLVVSELTRRKRMREGALKEKPETSVTEDLIGIAATPEAADSTLGSAKQMMAQAPQMAPQMPAQLAGQMPQMPQMMSGGGLVAFEKGGPIRAFDGMFTGDYTQPTFEDELEAYRPKGLSRILGGPEGIGAGDVRFRLSQLGYTNQDIANMDPAMQRMIVDKALPTGVTPMAPAVAAPVAAAPKPAPSAAPGVTPSAAPAPAPTGIRAAAPQLPIDLQELLNSAKGQTGIPSTQDVQAARTKATSEFDERFPFRQKEILEKRIAERTEELQRDKKMSFNDALLAAGAAVLSAPGGGTKWMGEGLKAFNQTMIEGKKDMRKAQQLIEQSEMDLMQAESLRDQGRFAAADRAEEKAFTRAEKARQFAQSDAAIGLQAYKARADALESESKAGYYDAAARTAGIAKVKPAEPLTSIEVMMEKQRIKEANPKATDAQIEQFLKQMYGDRYVAVPTIPPLVRGTGTTGATLPQ